MKRNKKLLGNSNSNRSVKDAIYMKRKEKLLIS